MSGRGPRWITKPAFTVQITANIFFSTMAYAEIDGAKYTKDATLRVDRNQTVSVTVGAGTYKKSVCQVTMNGEVVLDGEGTYTFVLNSDTEIVFTTHGSGSSSQIGYSCSITTK